MILHVLSPVVMNNSVPQVALFAAINGNWLREGQEMLTESGDSSSHSRVLRLLDTLRQNERGTPGMCPAFGNCTPWF